MKKLLIALCIAAFSSSALAAINYCPKYAVCQGSHCAVETLGSDWKTDEINTVKDGKYLFSGAAEGTNYCQYKVTGDKPRYLYFTGGAGLRAAINEVNNKWTTASMNHGCVSENVKDCPWTDVIRPR